MQGAIGLLAVLVLTVSLAACGGASHCDELADICATCPDPMAKATCEAHVNQGDETVCEFDVEHRVFEELCVGPAAPF